MEGGPGCGITPGDAEPGTALTGPWPGPRPPCPWPFAVLPGVSPSPPRGTRPTCWSEGGSRKILSYGNEEGPSSRLGTPTLAGLGSRGLGVCPLPAVHLTTGSRAPAGRSCHCARLCVPRSVPLCQAGRVDERGGLASLPPAVWPYADPSGLPSRAPGVGRPFPTEAPWWGRSPPSRLPGCVTWVRHVPQQPPREAGGPTRCGVRGSGQGGAE